MLQSDLRNVHYVTDIVEKNILGKANANAAQFISPLYKL